MNKRAIPFYLIFIFCLQLNAQSIKVESLHSNALPPQIDPEIALMVSEVSKDSLQLTVEKLVSFGTRHSLSDTLSDKRGIGAARRWVKAEMERYGQASNGRMEVILDPFIVGPTRRIPEPTRMKNVMATLKGVNPDDDRIFIISGHLDSRASDVSDANIDAPGANDDASGVALVMELARIMSKRSFSATVIFLAVQGEEQGLFGARHLAEKAREEGWNIAAMINNDMVGNTDASGTGVQEQHRTRIFSETIPAVESEAEARLRKRTGKENDSPSRHLARFIKEVGEKYVPGHELVLNYRIDRFLRGGDHTPFSQNGFTAVRMCEMHENYYHQHQTVRVEDGIQYGDLMDFVDFDYLTQNTRINLAALSSLAKSPASPINPKIKLGLGNVTELSWEAAKDSGAKGYFILMRETFESMWSSKWYVESTEAKLPYSKDNYFFAIQAVYEDGNGSLPVFPVPSR